MEIVLIVVAAIVVIAVALAAVGTITSRLAAEPPRRVFDNDEVVSFIAEALPSPLTAVMSFDDVQRIQRLHLDYLHAFGLSRSGGDLAEADVARLLDEDEGTEWIVERAAAQRIYLEPDHVRAVIEAQLAYFEAIGAIDGLTPEESGLREVVASSSVPGDAAVDPSPSVSSPTVSSPTVSSNGESHGHVAGEATDVVQDDIDPASGAPPA